MKLNSISRFVGMESFLYLEALSAAWFQNFVALSSVTCDLKSSSSSDSIAVAYELVDTISSMKENMVYANDLRRHMLPLSVRGHDGAKVSFVHQQHILVRDVAGQGFDRLLF